MKVSKYTLRRGQQTLVLQAIVHCADVLLYRKIQLDMHRHSYQGFSFMLEGPSGDADPQTFNEPTQREIAEFLVRLWEIPEIIAEKEQIAEQLDEIEAPKRPIPCDMPFCSIVEELHRAGFKPNPRYFETVDRIKLLSVEEFFTNFDLLRELESLEEERKEGTQFVLVTRRNKAFIRATEKYLRNRRKGKIYAQWGEKHIPGIMKLLLASRWHVTSREVVSISS